MALREMDDRRLGGKQEIQRVFDDTDIEGRVNPRAYVKRMKALKEGLEGHGIEKTDDDIVCNLLTVMEKDDDMRTLSTLLEERKRNTPGQRLDLVATPERLYKNYRRLERERERERERVRDQD